MNFEKGDAGSALVVGLLCGLAFFIFGVPGLLVIALLLMLKGK